MENLVTILAYVLCIFISGEKISRNFSFFAHISCRKILFSLREFARNIVWPQILWISTDEKSSTLSKKTKMFGATLVLDFLSVGKSWRRRRVLQLHLLGHHRGRIHLLTSSRHSRETVPLI
jgi:hypothetical protein